MISATEFAEIGFGIISAGGIAALVALAVGLVRDIGS